MIGWYILHKWLLNVPGRLGFWCMAKMLNKNVTQTKLTRHQPVGLAGCEKINKKILGHITVFVFIELNFADDSLIRNASHLYNQLLRGKTCEFWRTRTMNTRISFRFWPFWNSWMVELLFTMAYCLCTLNLKQSHFIVTHLSWLFC